MRVAQLIALVSHRPLNPEEAAGNDQASNEAGALDVALRGAFELGSARRHEFETFDEPYDHRSWSVTTYSSDRVPVVRLLAAPSTEPPDATGEHLRNLQVLAVSDRNPSG